MSRRTNEVQANVNATVMARRQRSLDLQLLLQVRLELCVDIVDDRLERIVLVDLIAIADGVADRQLESDGLLLQLVGVRLELDVGQRMGTGHRFEARVEQRVHQRRLAETRFADAHYVEDESVLDALVHQLIGQTVETDVAGQFHRAKRRGVGLCQKKIKNILNM